MRLSYIKRLAAAAVLACLFVLAGCGGGTKTVTVKQAAPAKITCHTMSCVLNTQPPPNLNLKPGGTPTVYGLDFAYGSITGPGAKALGKQFGASYLSNDTGKNWTVGNLASYHSAGLATVAVYESTATRSLDGCAAGADDARSASSQLTADSAPAGQPFTMAIDFDATGSQLVAVGTYFHCASLAEPGRVNAYGGYNQIAYLHAHGDVGNLNWQTYAWSNGLWLSASIAPLEQYLNGGSFDNDRAIAPNYGQWPGATPVSPKINHHYRRYPTARRRVCGCSERHVVITYDKLRAEQRPNHHPHRAELKALRHDAELLAERIRRVANKNSVGVWGVSPQWKVYHRSERFLGLRRRAHGAVVPRPVKTH